MRGNIKPLRPQRAYFIVSYRTGEAVTLMISIKKGILAADKVRLRVVIENEKEDSSLFLRRRRKS